MVFEKMLATVLAVAVVLVLIVTASWMYVPYIIVFLVNAVILYALLYRSYFDLKKDRWKAYAVSLILSILIYLIFINPVESVIWPITFVVLFTSALVETARALKLFK